MNFLETENVVKQYAGHLALNKVSIQDLKFLKEQSLDYWGLTGRARRP